MNRWVFVLPVIGFAVLAGFLFHSLYAPPPGILPSALLNKPVPPRILAALDAATQGFGPADLKGHVTLVNVFSSTCIPCRLEAPVLNKLARTAGVPLYGFVWKDKAADARAFLDDVGNPFDRIGFDGDGGAGLDWGVYGWPETYIVDRHGVIRLKYVGELTDPVVAQQVMPAIRQAQAAP